MAGIKATEEQIKAVHEVFKRYGKSWTNAKVGGIVDYKIGDRCVSTWINLYESEQRRIFYRRGTIIRVLADGKRVDIVMDEDKTRQIYDIGPHLYFEDVFDSPLHKAMTEQEVSDSHIPVRARIIAAVRAINAEIDETPLYKAMSEDDGLS